MQQQGKTNVHSGTAAGKSGSSGSGTGGSSGSGGVETSAMMLHSVIGTKPGFALSSIKHDQLPSDPMERVKHVFPALPAYALTTAAVRRIDAMIRDLKSDNQEERAAAESRLHAIVTLHNQLVEVLNEGEELLWEGGAVKPKDVLAALGAE